MYKIKSAIYCLTVAAMGLISANAQIIEPAASFQKLSAENYFRLHYDNDYFTGTDRYYTQGITLEYVHPSFQQFFLTKLLWHPYTSAVQTGICFNLFGFTPISTSSDEILYGDRPFDANMTISFFSIQVQEKKQQQLTASMSIGVMGPAALGEEIQTTIHRWLHNPVPHGWQYQVKNDLILNYEIGYEKQIVEIGHFFSIQSAAQIKAGTLINRVSGGFNFMAGHFRHKFSSDHSIVRKPECYIYGQSRLHGTAYDASLQGGILNRSGLYSIASEDISRISFSADAGLVLNFKKVFFSYSQSFQTKEFKTGKPHRWGGVSIGFAL